jgi:hypothetical protein
MGHDAAAYLEMLGEGDWAVSHSHCGGNAHCDSMLSAGAETEHSRHCSVPVCHLE